MTNAATSAVLSSTAGFVVPANAAQYGVVRVDDVNAAGYNQITGPFEIMTFGTNTTGTNTLSGLTRAQEGTAAHAFAAGAVWSQVITRGSLLVPLKFDDQTLAVAASGVVIPPSGAFPTTGWSKIHIDHYTRTTSGNNSDTLILRLNNDASAVYNVEQLNATNNTPFGASAFGATSIRVGVTCGGTSGGNQFGTGFIDIFNYNQASNYVAVTSQSFSTTPTGDIIDVDGGHRTVLQAVTFVALGPTAGNFAIGSRFVTTIYP